MRARIKLDVMAAVLALPDGPVRDEMWRLAAGAMENLGFGRLQNQVKHNCGLQDQYAGVVSTSPSGAPPHARDRVRLSSLVTRQLMAQNAIRERAFALARAEYYGLHGKDPLATLPPWLQPDADSAEFPWQATVQPPIQPGAANPAAQAVPRPKAEPGAASGPPGSPVPPAQGHATAGRSDGQEQPQHGPKATLEPAQADGADVKSQAGPGATGADDAPASMTFVKELAKRLRKEGLTHEASLVLRVETKQRKLTVRQVRDRAIELMMKAQRAKSK